MGLRVPVNRGELRRRFAWLDYLLARRASAIVLLVLLSLLLRLHMLGDPYYRMDESFYLLVGERLHQGARLYVDIWDRKPPLLFAIAYLAAAFPQPVLAYQLLAAFSAGLTAWVIARLVAPLVSPRVGLVVALWYLASLGLLDGGGGQSPVFYNLLLALAALLIARTAPPGGMRPPVVLFFAMVLAGLAILVKQTAAIEAIALGTFVLWQRFRTAFELRTFLAWAASLALAGALPALVAVAWFWLTDRLDVFAWAMSGSNSARWSQLDDPEAARRLARSLVILAPPLVLTGWSFVLVRGTAAFRTVMALIAAWLVAALISALIVPTHFFHYLLPTLVPLAAGMAVAVDRKRAALLLVLALIFLGLASEAVYSRGLARRHEAQLAELARIVRTNDPQPRLLVFQGPVSLYSVLGTAPLTPLAFPPHLNGASENNVSHLDTINELRRVIAMRPTSVIRFDIVKAGFNPATVALVDRYVADHCKIAGSVDLDEEGVYTRNVVVWSSCR